MSVINTNVKSLVAADALRAGNTNLATAMERLSTGKKINSAKDDAAGLAIGTRMDSQVRGLNMAIKNANDGINLAQTAEGAMTEVTDMLQRMRELAVQAGNSTNTDTDRSAMNDEVTQLKSEIDRISKTTQFNGMNILDGSFAGKLQIGNNASQTMNIAIGAVGTTSMGETTHGVANAATTASVQIAGAAQNPAAYQSASFNVAVNGVNKTVTLPPATTQTQNVAGANAAVSFAAVDATPDNSTKGQVGAFYERTFDLSTAANAKIDVTLNTGATQTIDISASTYYADNTKASGSEIVSALQAELNKNAAFQGANAMNVSIDNGHLKIGLASGQTGTIALGVAGGHLLDTTLGGAAVTTNSGAIQIGATTKSLSSHTAFDIGSNHFDLSAAITAHGYDVTKLTGEQFVAAYNDTAKVNGSNVSTASIDALGNLSFSGQTPVKPAVGSPYAANGDLTAAAGAGLTIVANTQVDSTTFSDTAATGKVGQYATTITAGTNDTLTLAVNGGQSVSITIPAKSGGYSQMSDLASTIQTQLNQNAALSGGNSVSVTAVQDSKNRWGLNFSNASGYNVDVSGNFLTADNGVGQAISKGMAAAVGTSIETTTNQAGFVTDDSTAHKVTVHGPSFPPSVGANVFTPRVADVSGTKGQFSVSLYGGTAVALDLSTAIAKHVATDKWDSTKMTGTQLVQSMNETFAANGNFAGDNAVTASLSSTGQIQLSIAKVNPPIGSTAPVIELADSANKGAAAGPLAAPAVGTFVGAITGLGGNTALTTGVGKDLASDANGLLTINSSIADKERFGTTNLLVAAGVNDSISITVPGGTGNPVNLTLDPGTYNDVNQLITDINKKITASGAFTGSNALTVSAVTDAATGNQGLTISSASGQQVKVGGNLISTAVGVLNAGGSMAGGFGITTNSSTVTFPSPGVNVGGVDLSKGSDVTLSVADSSGKLVTKSFSLANNGAHVSRSDYASALQSAANTAFAGTGVSFTAGVSNGKFSFAADQTSASSLNMTGTGVTAAFGSAVSGSATTAQVQGQNFKSMADVASAINDDLGGAAVASFDTTSKTWSISATGTGGTSSTISVSGAGLSGIQFGGTLSATGAAGDATASKLSDVNVLTTDASTAALGSIDNSIEYVSKQRSLLGAIENRLSHTVNNLTNIVTNTESSRSAIVDADYSKETTALAKNQILTQAATAMLAQANQSSQSVLSLLK